MTKPYVLTARGQYHRVRYDPDRLVAGARIRVIRGSGASTRLVPYVLFAGYDPRLGRAVAAPPLRGPRKVIALRSIDPLDIWDVTDETP